MPKPPIAISSCQLLTPLDSPVRSTWQAILASARVETQTAVAEEFLAGEPSLDRSIRLALRVAGRALPTDLADTTTLFCGTSKGPVASLLEGCRRLGQRQPLPTELAQQITLGVGALGSILQQRLGTAGPAVTSVAACSSGMHALHRAAQALWRGECSRALVVAADASLHPLFEAAFQRLGVLAPADAQGVRRCVPFAAEGAGFFLAEAAVALLLENVEHTSAPPLAYLEESWIGGDSTALVAIDEETQTLRHGLTACLPQDLPLAFVHAHATGTAHDAFERAAIEAVCGRQPPLFSHKQWLGHSLGAAGLVGVALSALCHHHGRILTGTPIGSGGASVTIAQGFGGHVAVARLRGMKKPA